MFKWLRREPTPSPTPPPPTTPNAILLKKVWPYRSADRGALSHFGGDPSLPIDEPWPTVLSEGVEQPAHFLAQIDCSALPDVAGRDLLPARGLLSFFVLAWEYFGNEEPEEPSICRVRWYDVPADRLAPRPPPDGLRPIADKHDEWWAKPPYGVADVKRFGFAPITPTPLVTYERPKWDDAADAEAATRRDEAWRAATAAALDATLGPEPPMPGNPFDDPMWPETIRHARTWLQAAVAGRQRTAVQRARLDGKPEKERLRWQAQVDVAVAELEALQPALDALPDGADLQAPEPALHARMRVLQEPSPSRSARARR